MTETGKRLQMNSRNPVFFLGYGEALTCALARVDRLPHTIYTNQNHKNHAGFSNFYNLEQKGLFFEEIQEDSTSFDIFRHRAQITLYDIYESKSQISRRENKKG